MSFLVEFSGHKVPEKQSVRMRMFSDARNLHEIKPSRLSEDVSLLAYDIDCTNVTWGEDVARYIANHFETIIVRKWYAAIANFLDSRQGLRIIVPTLLITMAGAMYFVISSIDPIFENSKILHDAYQKLSANTMEDFMGKIDIIEKIVTKNPIDIHFSRVLLFFPITLVILIITIMLLIPLMK